MNSISSKFSSSLFSASLFQNFRHSLLMVSVMLACSIVLIVLISIFVFISIQGGRYFSPMSAYQVTTYQAEAYQSESNAIVQGISDTPLYDFQLEYVLSHQNENELQEDIQSKLNIQFLAQKMPKPRVTVSLADRLFVLNTHSGKRYLGEFVSLQNADETFEDLGELNNMQNTVALLGQSLSDLQLERLEPLHRDINELHLREVVVDTPLYQQKLDEFTRWQNHANVIISQMNAHRINIRLDNQNTVSIEVSAIQELYQPNNLSTWQTVGFSVNQVLIFLSDFPKQASTSGGVFPAIFGTMLMVIIMAVLVTPFGAIAAIYLHEYAPATRVTEILRVCISNMASVPSVVYGVFGLGFFVYVIGGSLDQLLYSENLPSPTFGTPGLLWAALTMGILTLPVVIVSTEEGLRRVPSNLRSGALALGATKFETITKVVLPMASPGILTGVILAIARAAGEVAPLILVGAVKFAPTLPIDSEFPFVHLERQFMHLGVFIYDGAFHNQTESQVSSLMFATCMLLLIIVLLLNITAIVMRSRLRNKYERLE